MSPRGTTELRNLNSEVRNSAKEKEFEDFMKNFHEEVRSKLNGDNQGDKEREDKKRTSV